MEELGIKSWTCACSLTASTAPARTLLSFSSYSSACQSTVIMKTSLQVMAIVPFLFSSAVAQGSTCRTVLGTKLVNPVPTGNTIVTNPIQPTTTISSQRTTTIYVGYVTTTTLFTTSTVTTTDSTVTDTFNTLSTVFLVQTMTDTQTIITTSTFTATTSSTSTTTSATTAGFRNIRDTLNSDTLNRRRAVSHPHADPKMAKRAVIKGAQGVLAQSYPAWVACTSTAPNRNIRTVYTTLPVATRTIPFWYKRVVEVQTIMTTSTIIPDHVSTTITDYSTSTVQTTTTVFTTNTVNTVTTTTNIIPGPTVYDACLPGNIWGPNFQNSNKQYYAVNVANNGPGVASDFKTVADGASTAVDCCTACQQMYTCETWIFRARNRNCFLLYHEGATCNSQFNHPNFILSKIGSDTGAGYVVGNGNCGYTYSGNSDSTVFPVQYPYAKRR